MTGARVDLEAQAQEQAEFCRIFGHPRRIRIVWALNTEEMSVGELARAIGDTLQNTSRHLQRMKDKGVLSSRRMGQTVYYRLIDQEPLNRCHQLMTVSDTPVSQDQSLPTQSKHKGDAP